MSTRSSSSTALPNPSSDLFGLSGRRLLERLQLPQPWASTVTASLALIDTLDEQINRCERELRTLGADHRYVPLLLSCPGIGWILAFTIASEIGDIHRFPTPGKLAGYTGLCPRVQQSGDRRGPLRKNGPNHPRWALVEAGAHGRPRSPLQPDPGAHARPPRAKARHQDRRDRDRTLPLQSDLGTCSPPSKLFAPAGAPASLAA